MAEEERPVEWHGRRPDAHRYRCLTCGATMSTDNLIVELAALWRSRHEGHQVEEVHEAANYEPCTGICATWCPNCGDCTCPVEIDAAGSVSVQLDDDHADPRCPLHGLVSAHA